MHFAAETELWEERALISIEKWLQTYPGKRGVISDAIRKLRRVEKPAPEMFVRYEAHLNVSECDRGTERNLIDMGFEPDDFEELFPKEYTRNFTLSFDVDVKDDQAENRALYVRACEEALKICDNGLRWVFVEAERIPSSNIKLYSKSTLAEPNISLSKFDLQKLSVVNVPSRDQEKDPHGFTTATRKVIDVHVKLKGQVSPANEFGCNSSIITLEDLAAALSYLGLYKISSVSGNTIFTAQFNDGVKGQIFVKKLDALLSASGLATSMIVEPCFLFLRNKINGVHAPICPLLF